MKARAIARKLSPKTCAEWRDFCKKGKCPINVPRAPNLVYAKEFISWVDWFGKDLPRGRWTDFRPFKKARAYARALKLKTGAEWKAHCNSGKLPDDIPVGPSQSYKGDGWKGMSDWLGTGNLSSGQWRPFQQARVFARKQKLKSSRHSPPTLERQGDSRLGADVFIRRRKSKPQSL